MLRAAMMIVVFMAASLAWADGPENLTFEDDKPGKTPAGWFVPGPAASAGWTAVVRSEVAKRQGRCALLSRAAGKAGGTFGNLMQQIDATPFRGKRVVMTAWIRVKPEIPQAGGRANMWLRVDRAGEKPGFFDNSPEHPATNAEWEQFKIIADIEPDAVGIALGFMAFGASTWIDDVTFDIVGDAVTTSEPPWALTDQGLANLVAFARLVGYVRYYHPSDEAAACDWDEFVRTRLPAIEAAADAAELAAALSSAFAPIAPSMLVQTTPFPETFDPKSTLAEGDQPAEETAWFRYGFTAKGDHGIYQAKRLTWQVGGNAPENVARIGDHKTAEVAPGVWARVPIAMYRDQGGTLPRAMTSIMPTPDAAYVRPTGNDRTTRIADVVLAWNVFEHHYPYFDVVPVDWMQVLIESLKGAATNKDGLEFHNTLERLVARAEDGHGYVGYGKDTRWGRVPLSWTLIGDQLIVTEVGKGIAEVHEGDEVLAINGRPTAAIATEASARMSAATAQFRRFRTASEIARGNAGETCELKLRRPDGTEYTQTVNYVQGDGAPIEPRPEKIAEVRPGIWYVDIDRVNDGDINGSMDKLAAAEGLIFDLRGYPGNLSTIVLAHLTDSTIRSAHWCIPMLPRPDREGMSFTDGGWPVEPALPRWTQNTVFIIDGRAISYAETYMGIVETYRLAEIVGEASAGTNGNVTGFALPGGYSIGFTGMRVLKQDNSTHHGVGIKPTIPVERTVEGIAAGKDEYLEAAIAQVEKNRPAK